MAKIQSNDRFGLKELYDLTDEEIRIVEGKE